MTSPVFDLSFALGALTIAVFAYGRFNDPPQSRSTTTAFRFHTASAVYSFGMVGAYSLLAYFQSLTHAINTVRILPEPLVENLTDPLVSALLITGLLPQAPGLSAADDWLRERLKRMAAIPTEVRRLSADLRRAPFDVPRELRGQVVTQLRQEGLEDADLLLQAQDGPAHDWAVVTSVLRSFEAWRADPVFAAFLGRNWEEQATLRSRYEQLAPAVRHLFAQAPEAGGDSTPNGRLGLFAREYRVLVGEQIEDLHRRACELVSRGILECRLTHASRMQQLRQLGFQLEVGPGPVSVDQLMALFLLVGGSYTILRTLTAPLTGETTAVALSISLLIAGVYIGAVCCAIFPRSWWFRRRFSPPGARPWTLYAYSGLMASALAGCLSFALQWARQLDLEKVWSEMPDRLPWLLLAFTTAFVLSLQIDNVPPRDVSEKRWRSFEAAIQASAGLVAACIVVSRFGEWGTWKGARILVFTLVAGSMLGWLVPTWVRRERSQAEREKSQAPSPALLSPPPSQGIA